MGYYMWVYGRPLDWNRIAALSEPEHGRWLPDGKDSRHAYTDFIWDPRPDGVHFVCEEIPSEEYCESHAARYLHAIYEPREARLTHFDGALRVYTKAELHARNQTHVRKAGKVGKRIKMFRLTKPIGHECFGDLATSFLVWNYDVQAYFCPTGAP